MSDAGCRRRSGRSRSAGRCGLALILALTGCAWAADPAPTAVEPAASLKARVFTRLCEDLARADDFEARDTLDVRALAETRLTYKPIQTSLKVEVEARHESFDARRDGEWDLLLRDAYVEVRHPAYTVRFGNQTVTWGKLDDVLILDQISPQDYRWFVLDDKQARKDSAVMLDYRYDHGEGLQTEFVYLPVFQPSRVEFFGTDWSLFGHLKAIVASGSAPAPAKAMVNAIAIEDDPAFEDAALDRGEVGLRVRRSMGAVDYALYYMSIHNRVPTLRERTPKGLLVKQFLLEPTAEHLAVLAAASPTTADLTLEKGYERGNVAGLDFETTLGPYGVRGEWGFFTDQPFLRASDFSCVEKNTTSLGLGIDQTTENDWYWNVQLVMDVVLDYEELFGTDRFAQQVVFNTHKDFLAGDLRLDLGTAYRLTYKDWMVNPEVRYTHKQDWELAAGSRLFGGAYWTLFGRYDDKDLIYLEATYRF